MERWMRAIAVMATVVLGACNADESTVPPPTEASVVGTYALRIVNGGNLPFPYSATSSTRLDIIGGSLTVTADHTFSDALVFRTTDLTTNTAADPETQTLTGTWALSGSSLELTYAGPHTLVAVVTGKEITRVDQGLSLTYRK
ncbi:MAG TPA: hypothetical protein VE967_15150 [Gemmatimonadaceae bacterium]|nr:hypothetical protein [Gemmatimonadaceae bacterium]